jgi:hypothetical protein
MALRAESFAWLLRAAAEAVAESKAGISESATESTTSQSRPLEIPTEIDGVEVILSARGHLTQKTAHGLLEAGQEPP